MGLLPRLSLAVGLGLAVLTAPAAAPAEEGREELKLVLVCGLETPAGKDARRGIGAAIEELRPRFRAIGLEPTAVTIDTGSGAIDPDVERRIAGELAGGGRIFLGAESVASTQALFDVLKAKATGPDGVLHLVTVSTAAVDGSDDRSKVMLFRTTIVDARQIGGLLSTSRELVYPEGERLLAGHKEVLEGMAVAVQAGATPAGRREETTLRDDLTLDQIAADDGAAVPAGAYEQRFLMELAQVLKRRDPGRKKLARPILILNEQDAPGSPGAETLTRWVAGIVATPTDRAVAMVGDASFVARVNAAFLAALKDRPERGAPTSLFRFTGGKIKFRDLDLRVDGAFDGLHLFRTLPAEARSPEEQLIATRLGAAGRLERIEDHAFQSYAAVLLLLRVLEDLHDESKALTIANLDGRLRTYVSKGEGQKLALPFLGYVEFDSTGTLQARTADTGAWTGRHVYHVRWKDGAYAKHRVDPAEPAPVTATPPPPPAQGWPLSVRLALVGGLALAVAMLIRQRRALARARPARRPRPEFIENPYIYGCPVRSPELFFGRRGDLTLLIKEIERKSLILLIEGGRRSGKSSFLYFICNGGLPGTPARPEDEVRIPRSIVPVFFDMQEEANYPTEPRFLRHVRESIEQAVAGRGVDLLAGAESSSDNEYRKLTLLLHHIREARSDMVVLLLFDEVELLHDRMLRGTLSPSFLLFLKSRVEDPKCRVSVIFTGSPIDAFLESIDVWGKVKSMMQQWKLGPLSEPETRALASEPIARDVDVPREVQDEVYRLTGGQPFLTQAICHMAVNAINLRIDEIASLPATMTTEMLAEAKKEFVRNTPGHVDDMWSRLTHMDQYVLMLLARRDAPGETDVPVGVEELLGYAQAQHLEVLEGQATSSAFDSHVRAALERLSKSFLACDPPRRPEESPGYRFRMKLLIEWLKEKPIFPVIEALRQASETTGARRH